MHPIHCKFKPHALAGALAAAFAALSAPPALPTGALAAAALAVVSGPALATNVTSYPNVASTTVNMYMSGSSALDGVLLRGIAANPNLCTPNSLDIYLDDGGVAGAYSTFVAFCTPNAAFVGGSNLPGGTTNVAIRKFAGGGSGNGVTPLVNQTTLGYLNFADLAINPNLATICPNTPFVAGSNGLEVVAAVTDPNGGATLVPGYNVWHCGATGPAKNDNVIPQAGWSDAEPSIFTGLSTSALVIQPAVHIIFGIPVSKILRDNLQRAEGLGIGQDDVANMPSLQKSLVAGLFSNNQPITFANQLTQTDGTAFRVCNDATITASNCATASGTIFLARRSTTSGTQRTNQIYFLGQLECLINTAPSFVTGTTSATPSSCNTASVSPSILPSGGGRAFQMSTSEDLVDCLNRFNNRNMGAVGILSTDFVGTTSGTNAGIRFVKIDGVEPTLLRAARGQYTLVGQSTTQYVNAAFTGALVAPQKTVYDTLYATVKSAAGVKAVNVSGQESNVLVSGNAGSYQGVLAIDTLSGNSVNAAPVTEDAIRSNPVSGFIKPGTGTVPQPSCSPYQVNSAPFGLYGN